MRFAVGVFLIVVFGPTWGLAAAVAWLIVDTLVGVYYVGRLQPWAPPTPRESKPPEPPTPLPSDLEQRAADVKHRLSEHLLPASEIEARALEKRSLEP